jgi:hypothetical protein
MSIVLPSSIQEGQRVVATLRPLDQHGAPMTVGIPAWETSAATVADVSSSGVITAVTPGQATISATVGSVTGRLVVTITPFPPGPRPVASVSVDPLSAVLQVGQATRFNASPLDFAGNALTGRGITWSSSDLAVATVSSDGVVTAIGSGTSLIEALSEGQRSATLLNVTAAVDTDIVVTILTPPLNVPIGDTITIQAAVKSTFPLTAVDVNIGGLHGDMSYGPIGGGTKFPPAMGWSSRLNLVTLATGRYVIILTATDSRGHIGVATLAVDRDPKVSGGSKAPVGSK